MSLDELWKQLVHLAEEKGVDNQEFEELFRDFQRARDKRRFIRNLDSNGSSSNGSGSHHSKRRAFGTNDPEPNDDEFE
jgi:hypothetical protein